jgi:hypothetical protein
MKESTRAIAQQAIEQGEGIVRLAPTWVPRSFCVPGRRIKLHPDDYYALGGARGGIDERWFSSTTPADNGPLTGEHEGLSWIVTEEGNSVQRVLLRDAVESLGGALIGERLWKEHRRWPMYSKFFDNQGALPHHVHHGSVHAANVGQLEKPEAYFFPVQANNHGGDFPYTFFGINPGTTKAEVKQALIDFVKGDNRLTNLSRAYRLTPGTGWNVPPGVACVPTSRRRPPTCSPCTSRWWATSSFPKSCCGRIVRRTNAAISTTWSRSSTGRRTSIRISTGTISWRRARCVRWKRWSQRDTSKTGSATVRTPSAPRS